MRPKFLKQSRKTIIKRTNYSKESKKDSGIRSESEHENEEFQQTENESEEFLNDLFDDNVDISANRESKTSLDNERPDRKGGNCQNGPEERDIFIRNKSERETTSSNRPHDNPLSADDRIFLADDESSLLTRAISDTKVNKRRRQRNKRHIKESTGVDTLDENMERNLHVDMPESKNNFKNIKDTTKTLRHKTKQSAHGNLKGNLYNKPHSNSPENRTYNSKFEIPISQSESFPYAPCIGEAEAYADESSRGNFEDAPKAGYSDRSPSQPPSIGLSIKRSTEFNTQTAIEIYIMLVRSRRERLSFTQLTDILLANKRFQGFCENESDLVSLLEQNEDKFFITYSATDKPLFSVKTNIAICAIFTNNPCDQMHTCQDLHICKYFLLSKCPLTKCKFGHKLSTKHNRTVFRHFTLDEVDVESKMHLIRHIDSRNISTVPLVCKFYNNKGGCTKNSKCTHLHLCKYFIKDTCKFGRQCTRCHNILTNQPLAVLKRYGLNPTSFIFDKLLNALKGTLDDGDDLLKRNHQHGKDVNADRNNSFSNTNDIHGYTASDTTSRAGSDTDGESDDETDGEWTEQSLDDETSTAAQGFYSDYDIIDECKQTTENDVSLLHKPTRGNGCQEQKEQHSTQNHDSHINRDNREYTKFVMTFDSKSERKHFKFREVNDQLEITNESGNWHVMSAKYASRFYQLQDEFITLSENIIYQKQNKK